jgi:hypothetical protein
MERRSFFSEQYENSNKKGGRLLQPLTNRTKRVSNPKLAKKGGGYRQRKMVF